MSHAEVHSFRHIAAAGSDDVSVKADVLESMITAIDAAGAVRREGRQFAVDLELIAQIAPGHIPLVLSSVQRANTDLASTMPEAQAASGVDLAKLIGQLSNVLGQANDTVEHVSAILEGCQTSAHWWGLSVRVSHSASEALRKLSAQDVIAFLGPLSMLAPAASHVCAIALATGHALSAWIGSTDHGHGVVIKLYMWVAPWIMTAKA